MFDNKAEIPNIFKHVKSLWKLIYKKQAANQIPLYLTEKPAYRENSPSSDQMINHEKQAEYASYRCRSWVCMHI